MRVLFNGKFLTNSSTGVHRVAEELIKAVDNVLGDSETENCGFDVSIVAPRAARDIPLSRISIRKTGPLSGFLKNIPWEQFTLPWLARGSLLINLCNLGPILHGNAIVMIHDAQVYATPQSYSKGFRAWYKLMLPLLGKRARKVLTVSEYSKSQFAEYGVASLKKREVIHNGCDHVLKIVPDCSFVSTSRLVRGRYVLALADTKVHKNISVLLRAFSSSALRDLNLVLFGGAGKSDFEATGQSVPDNVIFVGRVTDEQLVGLMKDACAFACPSLTEGFGLPPLEAMVLGCPAIVAPCGALPEVCGDAALRADPHDPEQWIDRIRLLADDPFFAENVRRLGVKHAEAFTWEAAARKLLKIIDSVEKNRPLNGHCLADSFFWKSWS